MGNVLVVGSSNTDLVCRAERMPRIGETIRGSGFATFPGGKGANQAVAARRSGAMVSFVGAVGNDDFGPKRVAELRAEGIDVANLIVVDGVSSGVALIVVDASGDNGIVIVPGANDEVRPEAAIAAIERAAHAVLSLTLEIPFDTVLAAVGANQGLAKAVLNAAPFDSRVRDLLPGVDVLICNELEAGELLGRDLAIPEADSAARELLALGPSAVAITLGAAGAVVATSQSIDRIPAPSAEVVDTTGAGDAFCGVFAAWIADGASLLDAARAGVAAGSIAVTRHGAQPSLPTRDEVVSALQRSA